MADEEPERKPPPGHRVKDYPRLRVGLRRIAFQPPEKREPMKTRAWSRRVEK